MAAMVTVRTTDTTQRPGKELYSRDLTRSSACFVNLDVDLASMEEFVTKMVNAATVDRFGRIREKSYH